MLRLIFPLKFVQIFNSLADSRLASFEFARKRKSKKKKEEFPKSKSNRVAASPDKRSTYPSAQNPNATRCETSAAIILQSGSPLFYLQKINRVDTVYPREARARARIFQSSKRTIPPKAQQRGEPLRRRFISP